MPETLIPGVHPAHPGLRIETHRHRDEYVVRLIGELDLSGSEGADAAIRAAEESSTGRVVVDLDALEFIDSTGLRVLLSAKRRAEGEHRNICFTRGRGHVASVFRLTSLDRKLPFTDGPATTRRARRRR